MASLNKVMLIGRLIDNPEEPRTLPNSGSRVVKFRFAVGRSRKNEQGQWENDPNPLFIDCEAFSRPDARRDLVSIISQYCKKGDQVYVEGRLQLDQWEDKNGGGKRSKHKLVVDSVEFLGGSGGGGSEGAGFSRGGEGGGGFSRGGEGEGGGGFASRSAGRPVNRAAPPPSTGDDDMGGNYNEGGSGNGNGGDIPF